MVDDVLARVTELNADAASARLDISALSAAISARGAAFEGAILVGHDHLFSAVPLFVTAGQVAQMEEVVAAVNRVVNLPGWMTEVTAQQDSLGVFYGYDFHLNRQGAHLIEINTNAGGGFLNALLLASQRDVDLPGKEVALENPEQAFLEMFHNEWRLARGDVPLKAVATVDENPEGQYLYPEFLLAQRMFEQAGIAAHVVDPAALLVHDDGLYCNDQRIDMIYNRLTDFTMKMYPLLRSAHENQQVMLTPDPMHYSRYADKRNLARLSDAGDLSTLGASKNDIDVLQAGVPHTIAVRPEMEEVLWTERKQWFFKPVSGYGGKGVYRGEKLTRRVFAEIMQSDYVAQKMTAPGERSVCMDDGEGVPLKFDVRCYVYDGQIQLAAARLYQGQTTNFRTPGGGFALVRVLG